MENTIIESIGFYLLRVVAAVVVLLFGRFLAGRFRDLTKEVLKRPEVDEALNASVESILVRLVYYGTLITAFVIALAILGVPAAAILYCQQCRPGHPRRRPCVSRWPTSPRQ